MQDEFAKVYYSYSASKLFCVFGFCSLIKCHKMAGFGENVAELLLIPYIYINHIENESRYQFCA